ADRRTVVRRVGAWRPAVGEARVLREVLAAPLREELQDADAGDPQRRRLPGAGGGGVAAVHHAPAAGGAVADGELPRRDPLGAEAEEQPALAPGGVRLAQAVRPARRPLRGAPSLSSSGVDRLHVAAVSTVW